MFLCRFVDGVRAKMVGQVAGRLAMTARQLRPRGGVLDGVMVVQDEVEYFWAPVPDSQFVVGYSPVWKSTSASGAPTILH